MWSEAEEAAAVEVVEQSKTLRRELSPASTDVAIRLDGLSKRYRLGQKEEPYGTLVETVTRFFSGPSRNRRPGARESRSGSRETFWALRDVTFDIRKGEVVGLIGRNGAGKSTLLKILSRIAEPTEGTAEIHGSVSSLLEVGAGFHPELSGRENIFLNGAILGMRKTEIERKFNEIVAFAEVERFVDTAVKFYSSGMYVRLAFAVAAHLEPEILIIDEVLAVGDAAFQRKCLGKMNDVASHGRTILFVSHDMPAVQALCSRSLLLESGRLVFQGPTSKVIDRYLSSSMEHVGDRAIVDLWEHPRRLPRMTPSLKRIWMVDHSGEVTTQASMGGPVTFHVEYQADEILPQPVVGLRFETLRGEVLFSTNNLFGSGAKIVNAAPCGTLSCHVESLPLLPGEYFVTIFFAKWIDEDCDVVARAFKLTVVPADVFGTGRIPESGHFVVDGRWTYAARQPGGLQDFRGEASVVE